MDVYILGNILNSPTEDLNFLHENYKKLYFNPQDKFIKKISLNN